MTKRQSDAWATRIGAVATDQLRQRRHQIRRGIGYLIGVPAGVALGLVAFLLYAPADPPIWLIAAIGFAAVLSGCLGASSLIAAASSRSAATTNAYLVTRKSSIGVTAYGASEAIRSVEKFDVWHSRLIPRDPADEDTVAQIWTPDIRRPLLPGATAQTMRIRALIPAAAGLLIIMIMSAIGATGTRPTSAVWVTGWAAGALLLVVSGTLAAFAARRGRAEFRSGYTTTVSSRPPFDTKVALDLVDGKTGYLLRHAGSARLATATLQERRRLIRSKHGNDEPGAVTG